MHPVKPKWQAMVKAEMKSRGWGQRYLATLVGCTQPAISAALRDGASHSALVPAINKALNLKKPADPSIERTDPDRAELAELLDQLSDDDVAHLLATARRFRKSPPIE